MSNLQPNWCLKIDFQKVDQHAGGKWLIHDTKRRKDNQLQSLKPPAEYPNWVARCDIKGSDGTMLNPMFWKKVHEQKHPGRWGIVEHQIPSVTVLFKTNAKSHKHSDTWKHFPRYLPFVNHRWPVDSPHKGQWRGALIFFISAAEQAVEQKNKTAAIWDVVAFILTSL